MKCPQCSADVPAGFKFCGNCGARLGAEPTPESVAPLSVDAERRRVTVLFADVSGFTAMSEKLDPEDVFHVMNRCFERLAEPIAQHEGSVDKYIGDCVMALFGAPVAHENDPERAVRAGLDMQRALQAFQAEVQEQIGTALRMRIGLNAGRVIAGEVGSEHKRQYTVMGDAVNLANRLESAAQPGTVLVSESVYRQTNRLFQYRAGQHIRVKGKAEPVLAFELVAEKPAAARRSSVLPRTPCIGREAEMALLLRALADAESGRGAAVSISGAAGMGKSRLLEELADIALERKLTVLSATCHDRDAAIAYLPWRAILARLCGIADEDTQAARRVRATEALTAVDPSLAEWLPYLSDILGVAADHDVVASERKQSTQMAVRAVLRAVTRQGPVALLLDGAQWCDPLSAELFAHVITEVGELPLLVAEAHRSGFVPLWVDVPHVRPAEVPPLDEGCRGRLVASLLSVPEAPLELARLASERSGGSPFFIEELVESLVETGVLARRADGWHLTRGADQVELPETLEAVVTARIDRLSADAKHALHCAAVIGRRFAVSVLEQVTGGAARVAAALPQLEGEDFVEEVQPQPQWECAFRQGLTHQVAYEMVLVQQRRTYHGRIAQVLEQAHADRLEDACEVLAYHYARSDDQPKAVEYLTRAGEKALRLFALSDAEGFFRQALDAVGQLADPALFAETASRCGEGLGDIATLTGDYAAALGRFDALLADANVPLAAARRACILRRAGDVHARKGELLHAVASLEAALDALKGATDTGSQQEAAAIWRELAAVSVRSGRIAAAMEQARHGLELAEAVGSRRVVGDCCLVLGVCSQTTGDYAAADAYFRRSLRLREAAGNLVGIASALNNLGNLAADRGAYLEADDYYRRSYEMRQKMAHREGMGAALVNRGNVAYNRGRYADAQEHYAGALELAQAIGDARTGAAARLNLGRVLLAVGRPEEALDYLDAALKEADERGFTDLAVLVRAQRAETLAHLRRPEATNDARRAVELAAALGGRFHQAVAGRALGTAQAASGETQQAVAHLRAALATFEELGAEHEVGRTCVVLAHAVGDAKECRACLRRAAEVFTRLQAAGDLGRIPAELRASS